MNAYSVLGIHHVTAIAGDAVRNYKFYTEFLGLRLVKKTVNFDDPETYHFYFGNEAGDPGTILTFFPWGERVKKGLRGTHQITEVALSVPKGSLEFWKKRAQEHQLIYNNPSQKLGRGYLTILDPDGLKLELTEVEEDNRNAWKSEQIDDKYAVRGIFNVTITSLDKTATEKILLDILGYELESQEVNRFRYVNKNISTSNRIDIVEAMGEKPGVVAGGSIHHVAFRVKTVAELMEIRQKVVDAGLHITDKIDRNYFFSLYFREPGGVLFEIATDEPGFLIDEQLQDLGLTLKLPAQYESYRERLNTILPKI